MDSIAELFLFTDGSVDSKSGVGCGAYLCVNNTGLSLVAQNDNVQLKFFTNTSSTRLELQTVLWALEDLAASGYAVDIRLIIYTDSQSIVGLPGRRKRLEKNNYCSNKGTPLNNGELYRQFYRLTDSVNCQLIKVVGHQASYKKDHILQLFTLVDRASRRALRDVIARTV